MSAIKDHRGQTSRFAVNWAQRTQETRVVESNSKRKWNRETPMIAFNPSWGMPVDAETA